MIFASDLDSTLIYSSRHCRLINDDELLAVDFYNNNYSSITKSMHLSLQHINENLLFIPVTTRSKKEYKRIKYLYDGVKPKYAIVANGGIILKDGVELMAWADIVSNKIKEITSVENMIKLCGFFLESDVVKSYKTCEGLFIYSILDEDKLANLLSNNDIDSDYFEALRFFCSKHNYNMSKQGRKIYIVPNCINKYDPINFIMQLENINILIAAGDSLLDYPMIKHSNYGIIPCHGELLGNPPLEGFPNNVYITKNTGIFAGEEILNMVKQKFHGVNNVQQNS